jgi:hypothetical protein
VSTAELNASLTVSVRVSGGSGLRGLARDDSVSRPERDRPSRLPFREARGGLCGYSLEESPSAPRTTIQAPDRIYC